MKSGFVIRKNQYYDSVFLMRIAKGITESPGVTQCAVVMATDANKELLDNIGIIGEALKAATPNDLIVAVIAENEAIVNQLFGSIDERLQNFGDTVKPSTYQYLDKAAIDNPRANLVVISIPGEYAATETRKALEHGKHVFLFSDNIPLDQEVELKQYAHQRGLFVMGPDCGTSLIGGIGIGFSNVVRRGPIGVVGASGTGLQEFTSLIHQAGSGISHAIGTGTHDLSDAVGGITTLMGLEALEADPNTELIAIISKPAEKQTLKRLQEYIRSYEKPIVACFLGLEQPLLEMGPQYRQARIIDQAVELSLASLGIGASMTALEEKNYDARSITTEISRWKPEQRFLRGLFAGGTFCYQAQQAMRDAGISVYSNAPLDKHYRLIDPEFSHEHTLVDLGDDYFTQGKPHPMIDATQRSQRILAEADDPEVAVLLIDILLGQISSMNPAGDLIDAICKAKEKVARRSGYLTVVASICGTDEDPQGYDRQKSMLLQAGVITFPSSARAAKFCAELISSRERS